MTLRASILSMVQRVRVSRRLFAAWIAVFSVASLLLGFAGGVMLSTWPSCQPGDVPTAEPHKAPRAQPGTENVGEIYSPAEQWDNATRR